MEHFSGLGKLLMVLGAVILIAGIFITFAGKIPFLGKLPGDIHIQKKNFNFYFPLATSILISLIISLILYLIRKIS